MAHAHHKTDSHTVDFQVDPVVLELGQRFVDAGHELSLVGGPVRDLFLGRVSPDLDFTTDATPDQTVALIKKWADNYWEIGRAFGTIGMRKDGLPDRNHHLPGRRLRSGVPQAGSGLRNIPDG